MTKESYLPVRMSPFAAFFLTLVNFGGASAQLAGTIITDTPTASVSTSPSTSSGTTPSGNNYSCSYTGSNSTSSCSCQSGSNQWTYSYATPSTGYTVKTVNYVQHADGQTEALDLYLPNNATPTSPVVMLVHGGGWSKGSKLDGNVVLTAKHLAALGYVAAAIDYRLANPTIKTYNNAFPAGLQDTRCAVRFLRYNAGKTVQGVTMNYSGAKIATWGGSAGGNLVAMLGTTLEVDSVPEANGTPVSLDSADCPVGSSSSANPAKASVAVQYVADYYGNDTITDTRPNVQLFGELGDLMNLFYQSAVQSAVTYANTAQMVFPQNQFWKNMDSANYSVPPFLIVNGTSDTVVGPQHSADLFMTLTSKNMSTQNEQGPIQVANVGIMFSGPNQSSSKSNVSYHTMAQIPHNFSPFSMGGLGTLGSELGASTCDFLSDLQKYTH